MLVRQLAWLGQVNNSHASCCVLMLHCLLHARICCALPPRLTQVLSCASCTLTHSSQVQSAATSASSWHDSSRHPVATGVSQLWVGCAKGPPAMAG
jgi:hypothetical protein